MCGWSKVPYISIAAFDKWHEAGFSTSIFTTHVDSTDWSVSKRRSKYVCYSGIIYMMRSKVQIKLLPHPCARPCAFKLFDSALPARSLRLLKLSYQSFEGRLNTTIHSISLSMLLFGIVPIKCKTLILSKAILWLSQFSALSADLFSWLFYLNFFLGKKTIHCFVSVC